MTRRSPLWITALAVALGAAAWAPTGAGAQEQPADLWNLTIDTPAVVESRQVSIIGQVAGPVIDADEVTVTMLAHDVLPDRCRFDFEATVPVHAGRYEVRPRAVACNGPYQITAVAHGPAGVDSAPRVKQIGVGEAPAEAPPPPTPDGAVMRWTPPTDLDAHGWQLIVDGGAPQDVGLDVTSAPVPTDAYSHTFELVLVRWGAGGPGTDLLPSPASRPGTSNPGPMTTDPQDTQPRPIGTSPPSSNPAPGSDPPASSSTSPPATSDSTQPTRGTGAPSTSLPAGYTAELPYGVRDDAFVPGTEPAADGSSGDQETAAGTSPARGLVRTSEERAPALVAPFALGLLLITVAVHIAWFLRRSRPPGGGQVMPR